MKIMFEMNSIEEFQKILHSTSGLISTEKVAEDSFVSEVKNAGSCASRNINEEENISPNVLVTDKDGALFYRQLSLEHTDFDNINTAGQYLENQFPGNQIVNFSNSSQHQITSFADNTNAISLNEGEIRNAGACFQLGFNPN